MDDIDSSQMHSEENKGSSEKNVKRRFKTPEQVMALEDFYNEHKYPTEEMKLQLAHQIGLTEKQVSGWFCHRRLKEKRLSSDEAFAGGRQDRSSGVVQDRGSGLRQDSCGSTKQEEYRNVDPREVESRRLYGHDFPSADLAYESRTHYTGQNTNRVDDTSSESSSFLQDGLGSQREDTHNMENSRYLRQNEVMLPVNSSGTKSKGYKPSGYLKVKGVETENAAITAVKRQLGRNYREDGPQLGVEFDPLPPGAFESPGSDPVNEPFCHESSGRSHSLDVPEVQKQQALGTRYEMHDSRRDFYGSHIEEENLNAIRSDYRHMNSHHHQLKQKSSLSRSRGPAPGQTLPLDMYEDSAGETPVRDYSRGNRLSSKGRRSDLVLNHHEFYGGKTPSEHRTPFLHDYDNPSPNIVHENEYMPKPLNMALAEKRPSSRMKKVEKLYGERRPIQGQLEPVTVKMQPVEVKVAKRAKVDFPPQDRIRKASFADIPPWTNHIKRSGVDMPSSFSEDETAETSSSSE